MAGSPAGVGSADFVAREQSLVADVAAGARNLAGVGSTTAPTGCVSATDRLAFGAFFPMFGFGEFLAPELHGQVRANPRLQESMLWSGAPLSVSSSFSGVAGPEVALRYLAAAGPRWQLPTVQFSLMRCFEYKADCQKFLRRNFEPVHMHSDLLGVLPKSTQKEVAEIEKTVMEPFSSWHDVIMQSDVLPRIPCLTHELGICPLEHTDIELACPVCVDYSRRNRNRLGRNGPHSKSLLAWAKMMRTVQPSLIFNENSDQFDDDILPYLLGDIYTILRLEVSPRDIGHKSLNRPRAYTILVHKGKCEIVGDMRLLWEASFWASLCRRLLQIGFKMRWGPQESYIYIGGIETQIRAWSISLSDVDAQSISTCQGIHCSAPRARCHRSRRPLDRAES